MNGTGEIAFRRGRLRWDVAIAASFGAVIAAVVPVSMEAAAACSVLAFFLALALFDIWATIVSLLVVRSSFDVIADTSLVGGLNIAALVGALLILMGLTHVAMNRVHVFRIPLSWAFVTLLCIFGVGIFVAPDRAASFKDWLRVFSVFILYVLMVDTLKDERQRTALVNAVILSTVIPVLIGIYQLITGTGDRYTEDLNRVFGTFLHPSPYAFYLLTVLPFVGVAFVYASSPARKAALGLLAGGILVDVFATFTRAAWLGLIVALLVLALAKKPAAALLVVGLAAAIWMFVPAVQDRAVDQTSVNDRMDLWQEALLILPASKLPTGAGLGSVKAYVGNDTHNDYLRTWVEGGIVGSAAFLWLYGTLLKQSVFAYRTLRSAYQRDLALAFLAVVAGRLVMFCTDNITAHPVLEWYFWSLAGLTVGMLFHQDLRAERPSPATLPAFRSDR